MRFRSFAWGLIRAVSPPPLTVGPSPNVKAWIRYVCTLVAAGCGAYTLGMGLNSIVGGIGLIAAAVAAVA